MRSKLCMHFPSHSRKVHQGNTKVWHELVELFVDKFIFNTMIDVTLRDLETTKQGFELFSIWIWEEKKNGGLRGRTPSTPILFPSPSIQMDPLECLGGFEFPPFCYVHLKAKIHLWVQRRARPDRVDRGREKWSCHLD